MRSNDSALLFVPHFGRRLHYPRLTPLSQLPHSLHPTHPQALRRALDKLSFQKPGFITHRELSRAFESLGVRVANKEIIKTFQVLDQDELGLLPHEDLIGSLFGAGARKGRADDAGESEVAVVLRKRPDLLEEVVTQLRAVESQRE
jgi:hypothetical protein